MAPSVFRVHLFFDLDGTLTDSRDGIVKCIQHAVAAMGGAVPPDESCTRYLGPPLMGTFASLLDTADAGVIDAAIAAYRERFERVGMFENHVFPGIREALTELAGAGHPLCVVTAKPATYARRILERFELLGHFRYVYGPELGDRHYTKATLVGAACAREGVAPGGAIMIGDRAEDILGGKAHGLPTIGVTWGYGGRDELAAAGADRLVDSSAALAACIASDFRTRFRSLNGELPLPDPPR
jgi:phosphoglycolate phosphatase